MTTFPNDKELKSVYCTIYQEIHCDNMFMNVVTKAGCYSGLNVWSHKIPRALHDELSLWHNIFFINIRMNRKCVCVQVCVLEI